MVLTGEEIHARLALTPLETTGDYHRLQFRAMGTECQIQFACSTEARARDFRIAALGWIADFEARFSRFLPDSLISRINTAAGREWIPLDDEAESIFALCDWFHWSTRGVFDPSSLPIQLLWDYHRPQSRLPTENEVEHERRLVNWKAVRRENGAVFLPEAGMGIDLGGIGKEYAVDRVFEMARKFGIVHILVDFGHDLRVGGEPPEHGPWRVGLEDPTDPGKCWGGVAVEDRAVCSSGNYLRYVEIAGHRYGHIVDPRTGWPVSHDTLSTCVIAPTCTEAGILSTAAYILGGHEAIKLIQSAPQAEGSVWVNRRCLITKGFMKYVITD